MKLISGIVFVFSAYILYAQNQVVRDPIACAYGLKNKSNQWIVPARYQQLLLLENGFYACQLGEKWGILKSDGKSILNPTFDQISSFSAGHFLVVSNNQLENRMMRNSGIIDTAAKWLFEPIYASISRMQNNHYLLVKLSEDQNGLQRYESSISNSEGKLQFPFIDGILLNSFYRKYASLIGNTLIGSNTVTGNVRLVNVNGEVISSEVYDQGMPCGENFVVVKDGKFGLLNSEGEAIVAPQFYFNYPQYDYQNPIPCLHGHHFMQFVENGKKGILNGNWKVVVPANYDQINPINSNHTPHTVARNIAYIQDQKVYHLLDTAGKVMTIADSIVVRAIPIPKKSLYEQDQYRIFFCVATTTNGNTKWGILDHEVRTLTPNKYNSVIINADFSAILIEDDTKNPTFWLLDLNSQSENKLKKMQLKQKMELTYFFEVGQQIYPFEWNPSLSSWEMLSYDSKASSNLGKLTLVSSHRGYYVLDRQTNNLTKVRNVDLHAGQFPSVQLENGFNLIHESNGFLFPENKMQINQQFASINRIWAQQSNGKWMLYDTLGKLRIPIELDAISYFWNSMIVVTNQKKGLLDNDGKWIFPAVFEDLFQFSNTIYVGITPQKKVAVLNTDRPMFVDSTYTSFKPLVMKSQENVFIFAVDKNGITTCFDQTFKTLNLTEKQVRMMYWNAPRETDYALHLECIPSFLDYIKPLENKIYDKLVPFHSGDYLKSNQVVMNGYRGSGLSNWFQFVIDHATRNVVSLKIYKRREHQLDLEMRKSDYKIASTFFETVNWIQTDGKWREVKFNELFISTQSSYQQQILWAIQENPALRIDCNQPESLFAGASHFEFHPEGIKLYFFVDSPQAFELVLTKERLSKIASAAWIVNWL